MAELEALLEGAGWDPDGGRKGDGFGLLVRHATEAIVVLDASEETLFAFNEAAAELYQHPEAELSKLWPPELSPTHQPDGRSSADAFREYIRQALAGEKPRFEWVHLKGDGTPFPCEVQLTRLPDPERELVRAAVTDVSGRKQTEEDLRKSEARYRAVVEDQSELILRFLPDGTGTFVNEACSQYFGGTPAQFIGADLLAVLEEEPAKILADLAALTPSSPVRTVTRSHRRPDGSPAWIEWTTRAFFDRKGQAVEYQSVGRDITEAREARERLRLTQFAVDHSHDTVIWADARGGILYANDAVCENLGYTREEILDLSVSDIDPDHAPEVWESFLKNLRRQGHLRFDSSHRRKDGTVFPVDISASLLSYEGQDYVVVVGRDLTERLELEDRLRQSQKMEAIGQLTGGIAHDFNNLMSVILLHSEILAHDATDTPPLVRSALRGIEAAAEKAAGTTRKLLGFSRQATLERAPTDLSEVITGVASMLERVLPETIRLRLDLPEGLPAALVDPGAVEQMLLNLVNNARDALAQGGELKISLAALEADDAFCAKHTWAEPGPYLQITVTDDGRGMPEEVRRRIFEPFFTTKQVGEGSGLGLAMVYGMVGQHGGMVEAESEPGRGTSIHLFFPALAKAPERRSSPVLGDRGARGEETILLVEDEAMLRQVGKDVLEQQGYTVLLAEDGEAALDIYLEPDRQVDLIISDVVMPRMGGIELYHSIRRGGRPVRFLMASGYPGRQDAAGAEVDPRVPFIKKPWRMGNLLEKVREVLDSPPLPQVPGESTDPRD